MTTSWDKFRLLVWKNYLLQVRKPWGTIFEIAMPLVLCIFLAFLRSIIKIEHFNFTSRYPALPVDDFSIFGNFTDIFGSEDLSNETNTLNSNFNESSNHFYGKVVNHFRIIPEIFYSPQNEFIDRIMEYFEDQISIFTSVFPVKNSTELEKKMISDRYLVGVEFSDEYKDIKSLPPKLTYKLRFPGEIRSKNSLNIIFDNWRNRELFSNIPLTSARASVDDRTEPKYYSEGFILVQNLIFEAFVKVKNSSFVEKLPKIFMKKFPYPPGREDFFPFATLLLLPMIMNLVFIYPCVNIVKGIIVEKEKKLKKIMKIMGVEPILNWYAWFLKSLIYLLILSAIVISALKFNWYGNKETVFEHSSFSVLFVFMLIFSITTILFAFMITIFFKKSNIASAMTVFIWIFQIIPYIENHECYAYADVSRSQKLLSCLIQNVAMSLGTRVILRRESLDGAQWSNLFENYNDDINLGEVMVILAVDGVLYLLIIILANYFRRSKQSEMEANSENEIETNVENSVAVSNKFVTFESFLKIRNLTKVYPNATKPAVNNLNLSLHKDQITVLLGINGAGKSTTLSMLCGQVKPTAGTVFENGVDLMHNGRIKYQSVGVAFQEDVLFSRMTVYEHLIFYGRLKGSLAADAEIEAQRFMKILNLRPDDFSCNLSGGMKRKLCMGIALCANSKLVILDEISSGVDTASRREIWNILQSLKSNRTILMSTHFMLEAEVIADKISILSEGKLKAFGSPYELKQKFSKTCNLICVKKTLCDSQIVTDFVSQFISNIKIGSEFGMEISYKFTNDEVTKIHEVLKALEENMQDLNLESFGVSSSSMDEVIERVDENLRVPFPSSWVDNNDFTANLNENVSSYDLTETFHESVSLFFKQLAALVKKKLLVTKRNFKLHLFQIFLPMLIIILSNTFSNKRTSLEDQPELDLSMKTYSPSRTFVEIGTYLKSDSWNYRIFEAYKSLFADLNDENIKYEEITESMEETFLKNFQVNFDRNLFGVSVNENNITGWFNDQPFHTMPISLNLIHNAILKAAFGSDYEINIANKPLPYTIEAKAASLPFVEFTSRYKTALNLGFALAVCCAIFIIPAIRERIDKAKNMQMMTGINPITYWLSFFIADMIIISAIAVIVATTLQIIQETQPQSIEEFTRIFMLLFLLGLSVLPAIYVFSFIFQSHSDGFVRLIIIFMTFGPSAFMFLLGLMDRPKLRNTLRSMFLPFPFFNFCDAISKLGEMDKIIKICNSQCEHLGICDREEQCNNMDICCDANYFSWSSNGIMWHMIRFAVISVVAIYILFYIEFKSSFNSIFSIVTRCPIKFLNRPSSRKCSIEMNDSIFSLDPDVEAEHRKVENLSQEHMKIYNVVLKNVSKSYPTKQAVKQVSFAVRPGECFGLLGANGAGKTTTFRMLIGDTTASRGEIFIKGMNVKTNLKQIHKYIGYCGQFDALIDELTGRETLLFYAQCRGIKSEKCHEKVLKLANDFDFTKYLDKEVKFYSGGNKRKLSTAIALIGDPQIIFLDEPTSFMDPLVKRKFWHQIAKIRDSGTTIILSSHNMDDVEVLCTRIGIMMNGEMKCIGSPQYLKSKFGKTVVVTLHLRKNEITEHAKVEVKRYVDKELSGAVLKEEINDMLIYHLNSQTYAWSKIFKVIETAKHTLHIIDDFSVNQSNLVQVFLQVINN